MRKSSLFFPSQLLLLLLPLPGLLVSGSSEYSSLVEWIISGDGFVTPLQEMRSDSNGVRGLFATEHLDDTTLLARIPWTHLISDSDMCQNVRNLRNEMEKGSESHYAPYLTTLENYEPRMPYAWEPAALDLIKNLPPRDWTRHSIWFREQCGSLDDPLTQRALELYLPRAAGHENGHIFCPIFDHYNHRNGDWHNTRLEIEWGEYFEIYTAREIEEGEQLYNEYGTGTADIFRDYAFVEPFPQLWHIDDLAFELPDDDTIIWHSPKPHGGFGAFAAVLDELETTQDDLESTLALQHTPKVAAELALAVSFREAIAAAIQRAMNDVDVNDEL